MHDVGDIFFREYMYPPLVIVRPLSREVRVVPLIWSNIRWIDRGNIFMSASVESSLHANRIAFISTHYVAIRFSEIIAFGKCERKVGKF